jgi:RNA polymerase sigma factor (sigma-70 family)
LLRSIALMVAKTERNVPWPRVMEIASELLQESVREALKHAAKFDATRSASAWVRGIAARLLLARRRVQVRAQRCASVAIVGEESWVTALEQLHTESAESAVADRLDLAQSLQRLSATERLAIECRYYRGLDGQELASALGVSSPGAARVRVCRALQTLRAVFADAGKECAP